MNNELIIIEENRLVSGLPLLKCLVNAYAKRCRVLWLLVDLQKEDVVVRLGDTKQFSHSCCTDDGIKLCDFAELPSAFGEFFKSYDKCAIFIDHLELIIAQVGIHIFSRTILALQKFGVGIVTLVNSVAVPPKVLTDLRYISTQWHSLSSSLADNCKSIFKRSNGRVNSLCGTLTVSPEFTSCFVQRSPTPSDLDKSLLLELLNFNIVLRLDAQPVTRGTSLAPPKASSVPESSFQLFTTDAEAVVKKNLSLPHFEIKRRLKAEPVLESAASAPSLSTNSGGSITYFHDEVDDFDEEDPDEDLTI